MLLKRELTIDTPESQSKRKFIAFKPQTGNPSLTLFEASLSPQKDPLFKSNNKRSIESNNPRFNPFTFK